VRLGVKIAAHHFPWRGQSQRHLHQSCVTQAQPLNSAQTDPAWRRARRRQGRFAPREGRGGQAAILDCACACARRLGSVRPGRRNGLFQPNQEFSSGRKEGLSGQGFRPIYPLHTARRRKYFTYPSLFLLIGVHLC
jgi:hypothetical protein